MTVLHVEYNLSTLNCWNAQETDTSVLTMDPAEAETAFVAVILTVCKYSSSMFLIIIIIIVIIIIIMSLVKREIRNRQQMRHTTC